jgi:hypothetical protein
METGKAGVSQHHCSFEYDGSKRCRISCLCGGVFEYLHRSPASRKRQQKENPVPGVLTGPPYSCGIHARTWPSRFGESRIWDSKTCWPVPRDSDPRMTALATTCSNCKWQTRSLVRDSAPHQQTRNCLTVTKICPWTRDGTWQEDRLASWQLVVTYLWFWFKLLVLKVGRWYFGKPEEGELPLLEVTTKQWLVKIEKTLCVL